MKITKPQNMSELIEKYSIEVAKITTRKLPKDTLNNLIKKLEHLEDSK
ncbi:hypothetical protein [Clostridium botulinum]|nr:hypothetical protein [Clostridium botulinum]MCD3363963.1 hypothetical protein [Clostridium botulinum D/C]